MSDWRNHLAAGDALTVGELRRFIADLPDQTPVLRQAGSDDAGYPALVATVNTLQRAKTRFSHHYKGLGATLVLLIR